MTQAPIPTPKDNELHRIAVTGIIWKLDESGKRVYLITKRAPTKKAWPNRWTVPGGGLEVTDYISREASHVNVESPQWYNPLEEALRREIREEVNLEVTDISYLLDVAFIRPDGIPCMVISFYCKYESGDVKLDEDAVEFEWVTAEKVSEYDLIAGIDNEIKRADEQLTARDTK